MGILRALSSLQPDDSHMFSGDSAWHALPPQQVVVPSMGHRMRQNTFTAFAEECSKGPVPGSHCKQNSDCAGEGTQICNADTGQCECNQASCNGSAGNCYCLVGKSCIAKACSSEAKQVQDSVDALEKEVANLSQQSGVASQEEASAELQSSGIGGGLGPATIQKLEERYAKQIGLPQADARIGDVISQLKAAMQAPNVQADAAKLRPGVDTLVEESGADVLGAAANDFSAASQDLVDAVNDHLKPDRIALMTTHDIPEILNGTVASMNALNRSATSLRQKLSAISELANQHLAQGGDSVLVIPATRSVASRAIPDAARVAAGHTEDDALSNGASGDDTADLVRKIVDQMRSMQVLNLKNDGSKMAAKTGTPAPGPALIDASNATVQGAGIANVNLSPGVISALCTTMGAFTKPEGLVAQRLQVLPSASNSCCENSSAERWNTFLRAPGQMRSVQPWSQVQAGSVSDFL